MDNKLKLFGKRIAALRVRKNITQERLAELIGYSPNHISKLELARTNPSFDLIIKIADALEVEPKELFEFDSLVNPQNELSEKISYLIKNINSNQQRFIYKTIKNLCEI